MSLSEMYVFKDGNGIESCSVFGICNICIWKKKKKGKAHLNNGLSRVKDTPIFPLFLCKMNPKIIS